MADFRPHASYSKSADALYVYLSEGDVARTRIPDDRRIIDLAADGRVLGIEFVDASAGVDLKDIPSKQQVEGLIRDFHFHIFA